MSHWVQRVPLEYKYSDYVAFDRDIVYIPPSEVDNLPNGPGWQMWEDFVGSPVSPVFETRGELAEWLADNYKRRVFPAQEWLVHIERGLNYLRRVGKYVP